jgi:hypothetical protein
MENTTEEKVAPYYKAVIDISDSEMASVAEKVVEYKHFLEEIHTDVLSEKLIDGLLRDYHREMWVAMLRAVYEKEV